MIPGFFVRPKSFDQEKLILTGKIVTNDKVYQEPVHLRLQKGMIILLKFL